MPSYRKMLFCAFLLAAMIEGGWGESPSASQSLNDDDRKTLYHLAEGSELFPADWLAALDSPITGKPFLEGLERFGLIDDPAGPVVESPRGNYRLPIGVTLAPSMTGRTMVGVNCAACHVGQMTFDEKPLPLLDGAPNLLDIEGFYQDAFDSLGAALRDREKLLVFLGRLEKSKDSLRDLAGALRRALAVPNSVALAEAILEHLRDLVGQSKTRPGKTNSDDYFRLLTQPKDKATSLEDKANALLKAQADLVESRIAGVARIRKGFDKAGLELEARLQKALADLGPAGLGLVEARIVFLRRLKAQHAPDKPQYTPGPGRVDAFVTARNLLFPTKDALAPTSPVRYPSIWNLGGRKWLHWDANTNSILERNIGQALGLGALATKDNHSTVKPRNLHKLETAVRKLKAPVWPKEFGPILAKNDKEEKGRKLYEEYCAGCHRDRKGEFAGDTGQFKGFGVYTDVGTDPERAKNFAAKLSDGETLFVDALAKKLRAIKNQVYLDNKITDAEKKKEKYDLPDADIRWVATGGYVARPLEGAWATAPFLHNGSVPTLDDLLKPEAERPLVFPVGHREYDPKRLGYVSTFSGVPEGQRPAMRIYDTRQKGNSNSGHSGKKYGTELKPAQREALLDYLKGHKDRSDSASGARQRPGSTTGR